MQFYLFNIHPKLHHQKWQKLRVTLFRTFSTSPAACWCTFFIQPLSRNCYKLSSVVTFTFIQNFDQYFVFFTERRHVHRQCDA